MLDHRPIVDLDSIFDLEIYIYNETHGWISEEEGFDDNISYDMDWTYGVLQINWYRVNDEDPYRDLDEGDLVKVVYPHVAGRYEWTTIGKDSAATDSSGTAAVTEGIRQWKNFDIKVASLDKQDVDFGPNEPFIFRPLDGDYLDDQMAQSVEEEAGRAHLKDHWCRPDTWNDTDPEELGDYWGWAVPVSSSNIITIGGPFANLGSVYFNDFTDVFVRRIGETWMPEITMYGCWNRNVYDEPGTAVISTYKDINGTVGLIIYGYTGEDTYYACYALEHGLFEIMQWLQPGVTSIVLEFNYDVHPSEECFFHVVEAVGRFTECNGFEDLWDPIKTTHHGSDWLPDVLWNGWPYWIDDPEDYRFMTVWHFESYVVYAWDDFDPRDFVGYWWRLGDYLSGGFYEIDYPWYAYPRKVAIRIGKYEDLQHLYIHWETRIHPDP
jgi:hypothetical protein